MYIIISPAKIFRVPESKSHVFYKPLTFHEATTTLVNQLKAYTKEELKQIMKISDDLAQINEQRYNQFLNPNQIGYEAIYYFYGEVYKALEVEALKEESIAFIQKHVGILSGLYGLVQPLDIIQAYRLEMGTALRIGDKKNLYEFWKRILTDHVLAELEKQEETRVLINLASEEYSKVLDLKAINKKYPIIQISFKEAYGEKYKVVGMYAKKARGQMLRFIGEQQINTLEALKQFSQSGYSYNERLSSENHFIFTRQQEK